MNTNVDKTDYLTIQAQPELGERGKIDLFMPPDVEGSSPGPGALPGALPGAGVPGVVLVHGGGWARGDRTSFHWVARQLVQQGLAALTCSYRVSGDATFPACYDDLVNLLRWLKRHARAHGLRDDCCGLLGSSAGGHLVSLLLTRGRREHAADMIPLTCGVVYCPPLDMQTQYDHDLTRGAAIAHDLLGGSPDEQPRLAHDATVFNWMGQGFEPVPLWIAHGDEDGSVPIDDTCEFVDQWKAAGGQVDFHVERGAGHTMVRQTPGPRRLLEQEQVIAFLKKHLG